MTDTTTADNPGNQPLGLPLNDLLGQASVAPGPTGYSIEAVQVCVEAAYKAGQAAERERWKSAVLPVLGASEGELPHAIYVLAGFARA